MKEYDMMATVRGNLDGLNDVQKQIEKLETMPHAINCKKRIEKLVADRKLLACAICAEGTP